MYYKIKNRVLFRQYKEYGYITDNSMFGYRTPDDAHFYPGEERGEGFFAALVHKP